MKPMSRSMRGLVILVIYVVVGFYGILGLKGRDIMGVQSAAQIHAKLQDAAQAALKATGQEWARVRLVGQRAILEGEAPSSEAREMAAQAVLSSYGQGGWWAGGVTRVINLATVRSDGPYVWRADLSNGAAILRGRVPSEVARIDLLDAAKAMFPNGVVDQMEVRADGAPNGDWLGVAKTGLSGLAHLSQGEVVLSDLALMLTGDAPSVQDARAADLALTGVASPFIARSRVSDLLSRPAVAPLPTAGAAPELRATVGHD